MFQVMKKIFMICMAAFMSVLVMRGYARWLRNADVFQIRRIEIRGNDLIDDAEIRKLAGVDDAGSIWSVCLERAEQGIRSNPFVASARISRRFPDILDIRIQEKQALALLKSKKIFYAVDDSGLVLPTRPGRLYDMPVISCPLPGEPRLGKHIDSEQVQAGLDFLKLVKSDREYLYKEISEVLPGKAEGIVLYTSRSGLRVLVGEKQHATKIRCLEAVLGEVASQGGDIRYVDLRYQGQVIIGIRT